MNLRLWKTDDHFATPWMASCPPMYGRKVFGIVTDPSSFWKFSRIATRPRDVAIAVALRVWGTNFSPPIFPARMLSRRAWYSVQFEHEITSRYAPWRGDHASLSYFFAATVPMSPVHTFTTRYGTSRAR